MTSRWGAGLGRLLRYSLGGSLPPQRRSRSCHCCVKSEATAVGRGWTPEGRQTDRRTRDVNGRGEEVTEKRSDSRGEGRKRKEAAVLRRKPPPEVAPPPPLHALTHAAGRSELGAGATLAAAAAAAPWLSPKLTALTRTWPARGCTRGRFLLEGVSGAEEASRGVGGSSPWTSDGERPNGYGLRGRETATRRAELVEPRLGRPVPSLPALAPAPALVIGLLRLECSDWEEPHHKMGPKIKGNGGSGRGVHAGARTVLCNIYFKGWLSFCLNVPDVPGYQTSQLDICLAVSVTKPSCFFFA